MKSPTPATEAPAPATAVAPERERGSEPAYVADPYEYGDARALMDSLELAEPVAITLVRRGHRTPEQAREFLAAKTSHDPGDFDGIADATAVIAAEIERGGLITVHGDYDVDGICATAILIAALRRAGANCDWLIPDRAAEGYGISASTIDRLRDRGTRLLLTADCGISSVAEIAIARDAGIATVVTDHHQPAESLPECPIVHPEVSGYPFAGLCGAAVAYKLAYALGDGPAREGRELDLVALATVADMVPLLDENRALVRRGLAELRRARRPGLRALMAAARVEPEHIDEGDIAFRLGPRLNAAGRLYRADSGVELMLTESEARGRGIAAELDAVNAERRQVEREVHAAAAAAYRELGDEGGAAAGVVLAGEGWHPGVVGIAASRMVERLHRPVLLLSIDDQGRARGSGRSGGGVDLLAALRECAECLDRFGGHRAAAGLELDASRIGELRALFDAAVRIQRPEGPKREPERIDAVVGAEALDLSVAEQLRELGPFGQGNPEVRLLLPWTQVDNIRPMGEDGRHARFSLRSGSTSAGGVAFNANGVLSKAAAAPHDITVRLELNHWNGAVEPRAVLDRTRSDAPGDQGATPRCACGEDADEPWWTSFERELIAEARPGSPQEVGAGMPRPIEHPGRSPVALVSELLSSGGRVFVVCADARRRAAMLAPAAAPERFGGSYALACGYCPAGTLADTCASGASLVLCDWEALALDPETPSDFGHVVAVDPPPSAGDLSRLGAGGGFVHSAWGSTAEFAELCWAERWQPRSALAEIYRGLIPSPLAGPPLGRLLCGTASIRRPAPIAARCVRVLSELGIVRSAGSGPDRELRVVSSERTELDRSEAWRAYTARYEEGLRFLQSRQVS